MVVFGLMVAAPTIAAAFPEPNTMPGYPNPGECEDCHFGVDYEAYFDDCRACHGGTDIDSAPGFEYYDPTGPHGGYQTTSAKCALCHDVHDPVSDNPLLLPGATIHDTCFTCHDGSGGWGVYGTLAARSVEAKGGHSFDLVKAVPGGDAVTGGSSSATTFKGTGGNLTCTDCHSPHGVDLVTPFLGDRMRLRQSVPNYDYYSPTEDDRTAKLLKREPTGASAPAAEYGSDWCLTCHKGRDSESMTVHNHPVETAASAAPGVAYIYRNIPILASNEPTRTTTVKAMGGLTTRGNNHWDFAPQIGADNRGFLMPYPRTAQQAGHAPICQQCHEDSRSVGTLTGDGSIADATPTSVAYADGVRWDGTAWVDSLTDNPRFQNFPHETANDFMLVETGDDLCLNCHPAAALP